jgi:hypothetical protein
MTESGEGLPQQPNVEHIPFNAAHRTGYSQTSIRYLGISRTVHHTNNLRLRFSALAKIDAGKELALTEDAEMRMLRRYNAEEAFTKQFAGQYPLLWGVLTSQELEIDDINTRLWEATLAGEARMSELPALEEEKKAWHTGHDYSCEREYLYSMAFDGLADFFPEGTDLEFLCR